MFKWLFPDPTPDEALVREIKAHVDAVRELGLEADRRGITVWLRQTGWDPTILKPENLRFDEAYRTTTDMIRLG